ncbi:MAG: hypothetical protein AAGF24_12370, partial [Cyanobacteria bacterium P01_H01_bin.121]
ALIHTYQQHHQVSGLVWHELSLNGQRFKYPEGHPQLLALPEDLQILRAAKQRVVDFWQAAIAGLDLFQVVNRGKDFQPILARDLEAIAQPTEWATVALWQRSDFRELVLQLGWGQPLDAAHWRNWPDAGSEYIHAVTPGQTPICTL